MDPHNYQKHETIFISRKIKRDREVTKSTAKVIKGRWTSGEHQKFIQASLKYGCDWKKVKFY
jgi:hypothetical protein